MRRNGEPDRAVSGCSVSPHRVKSREWPPNLTAPELNSSGLDPKNAPLKAQLLGRILGRPLIPTPSSKSHGYSPRGRFSRISASRMRQTFQTLRWTSEEIQEELHSLQVFQRSAHGWRNSHLGAPSYLYAISFLAMDFASSERPSCVLHDHGPCHKCTGTVVASAVHDAQIA